MVQRVHQVADVVAADPDVDTVYYWVGANPTVNTGRLMIDLKPMSQRKASATEVINRLRRATAKVPGIALFGQARQDVQIGARVTKTQYQYTLQDPNVAELFQWAPVVLEKLAALPQFQDVTGDLQATAPRLMLKLDRDVIGRLGLSPQLIDDTLYDAFGQRQVAVVFGQLDQRRVILEVEPSVPGRRLDAAESLRPHGNRAAHADVRSDQAGPDGIAADHQPHRSVPVGDVVVQSRAGILARRCVDGDPEHGAFTRQAGGH